MGRLCIRIIVLVIVVNFFGCREETRVEEKINFNQKISFDPTMRLSFKPNIVWLIAEDLGPMIPAFGDSTVTTPNLDRLAYEGIRYTNLYSTSGGCVPNHFALASGIYPTSIGGHNTPIVNHKEFLEKLGLIPYEVVLPSEVKLMSQVLRENGYYCSDNDKQDFQFILPATTWDEISLKAHWKKRQPGQPFFAVFNFDVTQEGHVTEPFTKADTRYDDPDFPDINLNNYSWNKTIKTEEWALNVPEYRNMPIPPYLPQTGPVKKDLRRAYSNIIDMDRQVGVILKHLELDGLLDSTIVFWFSDNGGPLPRQKRLLYDGGIHVPMIIRFPGKKAAGTYNDELISIVDFAPTTFSIAEIRIPGYVQGQPFLGRFKADRPRKYVFAASDRFDSETDMIRTARDKRYKYFQNFHPEQPYYLPIAYRERMATMKELLRLNKKDSLDEFQAQWFRQTKPADELFDTRNDPYELHNIAGDSAYTGILAELRSACVNWMNEYNDMGSTPEDQIINLYWPGRKQLKTENLSYNIEDQKVILSCKTEGSNIAYQVLPVDSIPGISWAIYKDPIKLKPDIRIIAIAHRIGFSTGDTLKIEFR